jgi:hypothetical protein
MRLASLLIVLGFVPASFTEVLISELSYALWNEAVIYLLPHLAV